MAKIHLSFEHLKVLMLLENLPGWITGSSRVSRSLAVAEAVFEKNLETFSRIHRLGDYRFTPRS